MSLHKDYEDSKSYNDFTHDEADELAHKKRIRQMLDKKMENKRLKEELEYFDGELDGEFDWDQTDK